MSRRDRPAVALIYTLASLVVLLAGWNAVARLFAASQPEPWVQVGDLFADASRNDALGPVLDGLPEARDPRVLVLGSSQMIVVKREPQTERSLTIAGQLAEGLREAGQPASVVDLSAGGQRVSESLAIFVEAGDVVRPRVVVLGVGLFSMRSLEIRTRLLEQIDGGSRILAAVEGEAESLRERAEPLLKTLRAAPKSERDRTVQERVDDRISGQLERLAFFRHRNAIFDQWIDRPIRQDFFTWLKGSGGAATGTTARTFEITSAYEPSVAAIELLASLCKARGVRLVIVSLPFNAEPEPPVYLPEEHERLERDLGAISGAVLVDLSDALGVDHFETFVDGSPDPVHFDRGGHHAVAQALLPELRAALRRNEPAVRNEP